MTEYGRTLESAGASIEWVHVGDGDSGEPEACVLMSQLSRLLLYQRRDLVRPDDIILTMDVNAFVMTPKILDPIRLNPGKKVWLMQVHTLKVTLQSS